MSSHTCAKNTSFQIQLSKSYKKLNRKQSLKLSDGHIQGYWRDLAPVGLVMSIRDVNMKTVGAKETWDGGIESTATLQTLERRGHTAVLRNPLFLHVCSSEVLAWIRI